MRTLLICHDGVDLNRHGLARWLASFSSLVGIVAIREDRAQVRRRILREFKRVGALRFLDVLAMRVYYKLILAASDRDWQRQRLAELSARYPELPEDTPILYTESPNSGEAEAFIRRLAPDLMVVRCKRILAERIFSIPAKGTFIFHPGVCPEYRNAHGCFWALAKDDLKNVGMTLLQIDKGIDTGPIYGYYTYAYDEVRESHTTIMWRVVLENLDAIRDKLEQIASGTARPIDVSGRSSGMWGQPWLTQYLRWKRRARERAQP